MNTNNCFFSFSRFTKVVRKDVMEVWKKHLLRFAVLYGLLTIDFMWLSYLYSDMKNVAGMIYEVEMIVFVWALLLGGCYSASLMGTHLKDKLSRFSALMLPATQVEKFFSRWGLYVLGFIVFYFLAFFLADFTRYLLDYILWPDMENLTLLPFFDYLIDNGSSGWNLFYDGLQLFGGITCYFFLQSFFVLGSFVWPKHAFLKTFVAMFAIIIVFVAVLVPVCEMLIYQDLYIPDDAITLSEKTVMMICCLLAWLLTFVNWVLSYYRFKELEIINRW